MLLQCSYKTRERDAEVTSEMSFSSGPYYIHTFHIIIIII